MKESVCSEEESVRKTERLFITACCVHGRLRVGGMRVCVGECLRVLYRAPASVGVRVLGVGLGLG